MRRLQVMLFFIMSYGLIVSRSASGVSIEAPPKSPLPPNDTKADKDRYYEFTEQIEDYFRKAVKMASKPLIKYMMRIQEDSLISGPCEKSLMKYLVNLMKAKLWAVQMLDATSKIPPGILTVTFADFGSFDECLDVNVYHRDGTLDFQGSSCAVEVLPPMSPVKENSTKLHEIPATGNGEDTLGARLREGQTLLRIKPAKFIVCLPSTCSLGDLRRVARRIMNETYLQIRVQKCYVKEETVLLPIHYVVLTSMGILLILGICGTLHEKRSESSNEKLSSTKDKILLSFSLSSNFKRFSATSGGSAEFKCIHGVKTLTIFFVILVHTYGYMNFNTPKDPIRYHTWLTEYVSFQMVYNAWPAVETFFLLSGILVTYAGLKAAEKTGGKLNIPFLILHRYLRLTPSVLLLIGLVFFLPLLSSGPFWFDDINEPIQSCRNYWWTTLLYFHNWWGIQKTCLMTTWYLAADFQLHILSLFLLIILFRYAKATLGILFILVLISCSYIGLQTWYWNLSAIAPFSEGDDQKVFEMINKVHINTFTHLGPHCIGMLIGYYIYNCKGEKISKPIVMFGWCAALMIVPLAWLGSYRFATAKETSRALTILYASLNRCVFTCGIAWMLLACITGNGGAFNAFLSSSIFAPVGRLTYMIYLLHPLVIRIKYGSMRERPVTSHYEFMYIFITNTVISIALAIPFYLLLEAPLSNLERLLMHRSLGDDATTKQTKSPERNGITLTAVKSQ